MEKFSKFVEKSKGIFIVLAIITGVGIALSFYSNQALFENLNKLEGDVIGGDSREVTIELDYSSKNGIFAVQAINAQENSITARVFDPFGSEISSLVLSNEPLEEQFEIIDSGTYKLQIENSAQENAQVIGFIGEAPDAGKRSIVFVSGYLLIIGLLGMGAVGIFIVKQKRKSFS